MDKNIDNKKRILITANHSYIGNAFAAWTEGKYDFSFISCRTEQWKRFDFSGYDVVLHVAGIAHVEASANMEAMYYKVNRDLTVALAEKAAAEGVGQFIFLSSAIVFGESSAEKSSIVIMAETEPCPNGFYGDSKLQAEKGLLALAKSAQSLKIAIIRPPMIYGVGSKGNFPKLAKLARILPIFPDMENRRSMLHIDNLCEFIRLIIENEESGIFHPQNREYVNSSELVTEIARINGKKMKLTKVFNPLIMLLGKRVNAVNKLFGTFTYDMAMSQYKENYCIRSFKESLELTEK